MNSLALGGGKIGYTYVNMVGLMGVCTRETAKDVFYSIDV